MTHNTFLDILAKNLLKDYKDKLSETIIVLPNRRAKVFLIDSLRKQLETNLFAPQIISIEDFIQDVAGIRGIDNIEQLFEFYEVYCNITPKENRQSFELFANWAKTLLQDFNEIDRYLLEPKHVLSYLKDIEDIKHWSLDPEKKTPLIENYLKFWEMLPIYYEQLYSHLLSNGKGYQGLIYREAVRNMFHFSESLTTQSYVFAGFNALNAAEEVIIQHLIDSANAAIYWDSDATFQDDAFHDAGLFLRRFKNTWPHYKANSFEWIFNDFQKPKDIQIIGTPKTIGQAKIVGHILEKKVLAGENTPLSRTAIVLGEENLLVPLLYSLPAGIDALNITMGYSGKNNPVQILISKLFKLHSNALSRNPTGYVMYYKEVLDILTHPLVEPFAKANDLVAVIKRNNYTFVTHKRLMELHPRQSDLFTQLFEKWDQGAPAVLERLSGLLQIIKSNLSNDNEEEKIAKAFVYAIFKVINKLISYYSGNNHPADIETLFAVYKQVVDLAEVSFEGEPLYGLQIMGVLESRVLDFDTVIVTSMNEGKFPAGKTQNSFIPYDVKKELGLPTFKEKDAIYTYHFYHLLQRAKTIYLLYNTESDGLDGGEKSRFITQLEVEKQPLHTISHEIYNPQIPDVAYQPIVIPKSKLVLERLREIAEKGFSPSALTSYIRNPLQFYFQKVLRIGEAEEVEENIALNTLGTIIHETLRVLYQPLIGTILTELHLKHCISQIDEEVLSQFKLVYKEGEIKKGRNLLAFEVAKRNVLNFLKYELDEIEKGADIRILALEQTYSRTLEHPSLPFPVKIQGNVDRIEQRDGRIRIIDYKTGKVMAGDVVLKKWDGLTTDVKNDKIIQVLAYAFMYEPHSEGREMEVGIVSFKNMKNGFLPFVYAENKIETRYLTNVVSENYIEQLTTLIKEILDPESPFLEKID